MRLWDLKSDRETAVLRGHKNGVTSVAWSPNGHFLASAGYDGRVIIWDTVTATKVRELKYGDSIFAMTWSPDGLSLAAGGFRGRSAPNVEGTVLIWNAQTGAILKTLTPEKGQMVRSMAWSPDGKVLVSSENFNGLVHLWVSGLRQTRKDIQNARPLPSFDRIQSGQPTLRHREPRPERSDSGNGDREELVSLGSPPWTHAIGLL